VTGLRLVRSASPSLIPRISNYFYLSSMVHKHYGAYRGSDVLNREGGVHVMGGGERQLTGDNTNLNLHLLPSLGIRGTKSLLLFTSSNCGA